MFQAYTLWRLYTALEKKKSNFSYCGNTSIAYWPCLEHVVVDGLDSAKPLKLRTLKKVYWAVAVDVNVC